MSETTKEELRSLVKNAVAEAMSPTSTDLTCPECHAKFDRVPTYLDHRVAEYMDKSLEGLQEKVDAFKIPTAEEFLTECKDGLCKIVEETYDVTKKGEAPAPPEEEEAPGLFGHYKDEPEEE